MEMTERIQAKERLAESLSLEAIQEMRSSLRRQLEEVDRYAHMITSANTSVTEKKKYLEYVLMGYTQHHYQPHGGHNPVNKAVTALQEWSAAEALEGGGEQV